MTTLTSLLQDFLKSSSQCEQIDLLSRISCFKLDNFIEFVASAQFQLKVALLFRSASTPELSALVEQYILQMNKQKIPFPSVANCLIQATHNKPVRRALKFFARYVDATQNVEITTFITNILKENLDLQRFSSNSPTKELIDLSCIALTNMSLRGVRLQLFDEQLVYCSLAARNLTFAQNEIELKYILTQSVEDIVYDYELFALSQQDPMGVDRPKMLEVYSGMFYHIYDAIPNFYDIEAWRANVYRAALLFARKYSVNKAISEFLFGYFLDHCDENLDQNNKKVFKLVIDVKTMFLHIVLLNDLDIPVDFMRKLTRYVQGSPSLELRQLAIELLANARNSNELAQAIMKMKHDDENKNENNK